MAGEGLAGRAFALAGYVDAMRSETGYEGPIDVVCHSFGACIARQCLEVADGAARHCRVGLLVMLGPPNTGSALAELFSDPERGPAVIATLERLFVPAGFDPFVDAVVQDVRPGSPTMRSLRAAGLRADIAYRVIATANPGADPAFFPRFDGKTWELDGAGRFRRTLDGDGVVATSESALPGVPLDLLVPGAADGGVPAGAFCHIGLPRNPAVIERVMLHLSQDSSDPIGRTMAGADRMDDPCG
jgi:pimeloyl-ACP methyl ester carboxylesterase